MGSYLAHLAKAEETAAVAAKTDDPIMRRALLEMETIYRLLARLAIGPLDADAAEPPQQERPQAPFSGALIDGSPPARQ